MSPLQPVLMVLIKTIKTEGKNNSRIIAKSAAPPYMVAPINPSVVRYLFSGEVEGDVYKYPSFDSTNQSMQNSAAPFISG